MSLLPMEILIQIMRLIHDVTSLGSLVRTCGTFHRTYYSNRELILSEVLLRQLGADGGKLSHPLMAAWTSTKLKFPEGFQNQYHAVVAVLDRYRRSDELGYEETKRLHIDDCLPLIRLQNVADFLIQDFEAAYVPPLHNIHNPSNIKLSSFERRRLKRAIFRWQIYRNVFEEWKTHQGPELYNYR